MTGAEFRAHRKALGLSGEQMARVMGYGWAAGIYHAEKRALVPAQAARLMQAYVDGYRPADWPGGEK